MGNFYIKTNRIFNPLRKYTWLFAILVAFGGLWYPKLGLLLIPLMTALLVLGFFKGKFWCGNLCPHGSLFDYILIPYSPNKKIPKFLKSKVTIYLALTWFMFMLVRRVIIVSAYFGTANYLDKLGFIFVVNYLVVTVVGSILAVTIAPRAWCSICPMGNMQTLSYKLGKLLRANKNTDKKVSISQVDKCHSCGKCARVCPIQLTPYTEFSANNQFDNETCIRCSTCVANCPAGILAIETKEKALETTAHTSLEGYEERQQIIATIESIKQLTDDINEYTFKFVKPKKVEYPAGQFILVKIQGNPNMFRAYSISSYNEDGTKLSATIKRVKDGFGTDIIFETFKEGMKVELEGPMGDELTLDKSTEKLLFVAGGIGITPFVGMAKDMLVTKNSAKVVKLIYGANYESEFIYNEYFEGLASQNAMFEFVKVAAFDENWKGKKGFVTDVIKEMDLEGYKVYMCGPPPMIKATLKTLQDKGVKEEDIFYESA